MSELTDIITLSDEQEDKVEPIFENILLWHRKERLPQYIKWIDEYKKRLNKGLKMPDMIWVKSIFDNELRLVLNKVIDEFAHLSTEITPKQIKELQAHFNTLNKKSEKNFKVNKKEYFEEVAEITAENLEKWIDDLTKQQYKIINKQVAKLSDLRKPLLAHRKNKQEQWITLLKSRLKGGKNHTLPLPEFKKKMMRLTVKKSSDYLIAAAKNHQIIQYANLSSIQIITPEQKEYLIEELDSYRDEFVDLIND
jgi:hypothetical protein